MKKIAKNISLLLCVAVVAASCERKPIYDDCVCNNTLAIPIDIDWEPSGVDLQNVSVLFYDAEDGSLAYEHQYEHNTKDIQSYAYLPTGRYTAVVFNELRDQIDYLPLEVSEGATLSDPIYFYPNSGGDYQYQDNAANQTINPQYIVIKGVADGYDTPGYYKVALKAQYPLDNPDDESETTYSALTYDILRNSEFTVKLIGVDKPGYKTIEDAADPNSPASNISYSMTVEVENNRYEVLVSNGTYFARLVTSD
ncbi:MAG: DUF5119 domain-containing protein [Rikenellaceae bacterium]